MYKFFYKISLYPLEIFKNLKKIKQNKKRL